jgi:hypothetical protein
MEELKGVFCQMEGTFLQEFDIGEGVFHKIWSPISLHENCIPSTLGNHCPDYLFHNFLRVYSTQNSFMV